MFHSASHEVGAARIVSWNKNDLLKSSIFRMTQLFSDIEIQKLKGLV